MINVTKIQNHKHKAINQNPVATLPKGVTVVLCLYKSMTKKQIGKSAKILHKYKDYAIL